jgi:tetratricopeptide (TPR) repeat protein
MAKTKAKAEKQIPSLKKNFWFEDRNVAYILGAFAFLLYSQTIGFKFALDDVAVLTGNTYVKDGFGGFGKILSTFYWSGNPSFADANSGIFRPVSLLMFATEWQIFGEKPGVFHFIHIVLYAVVAMQLFLLLRELFGKSSGQLALVATLLWIVLPIHTEVVANLKSADEILSLLFSLLGLRFIVRWSNINSTVNLLMSCAFFFLALLSKEAAVLILPLALLGLIMFRDRNIKSLIAPVIAFGIITGVWLLWHMWVINSSPSKMITYDYRNNALLSNSSSIDQLGTAIGLQARYWIKMLIGYPLSWNYSFNEIPVDGFADVWPWISLIGIGAAGYFAWKTFKTQPIISFAIIFYFVTIVLTSNIFYKIGDIFAERFTFVPSIGFCILISALLVRYRQSETAQKLSSTALGIFVIILLAYTGRTFARTSDWKDESTLFLSDVDHAPQSARVHGNVGIIYLNSALGQKDEAVKQQQLKMAYEQLAIAEQIDSNDYQSSKLLGQVLYLQKDYKASIHWSELSVLQRRNVCIGSAQPVTDDAETFLNLAYAFEKLEQYDSTLYYYTASSKTFAAPSTYLRIGDTYLRMKDTVNALSMYDQSVQIDTALVEGWDKIGNIKGMRGDYEGSNSAFQKIAQLKPEDPGPWKMLYTNYGLMGDSLRAQEAAGEYFKRGGQR